IRNDLFEDLNNQKIIESYKRILILDKLRDGKLKGLLCTSALGQGIDIPHINNIMIYKMPRNFSTLLQEFNRGTRNPDSVGNVFLLLDDQKLIDNFFIENPERLQEKIENFEVEPMSIDLLNERILGGMILYAIRLGIETRGKLKIIFKEAENISKLDKILTRLMAKGLISKFKDKYIFKSEYSNNFLYNFLSNLRTGFPRYKVISKSLEDENELGYIGSQSIPFRNCVGNYYEENHSCYLIKRIDKAQQEIYVERVSKYRVSGNQVSTQVVMMSELQLKEFKNFKLRLGEFKVTVLPELIQNFRIENNLRKIDQSIDPKQFGDEFILNFETTGLLIEFNFIDDGLLDGSVLYQLSSIFLANAVFLININQNEVDHFQEYDRKFIYFLDRAGPTGVSKQIFEHFEYILEETMRILESCGCYSEGCDKCCIPIQSNYLMPNYSSDDKYRRHEMIDLLKRCLNESSSIE
ncbi:MAG: helicase-related protein, partial [Candidatus Thorarchaeota archaeon]